MDSPHGWTLGVASALGLLFLWLSLWLRGRERLLRDTPTSKAKGVFIGLVELKGKACCDEPLHAFLSERAVVHYRWEVTEHWSRTVTEHYTDSKGRSQTRTRHESGWKTIAEGGERCARFEVRDETGSVQVRPKGAKIEPLCLFEEECTPGDALYYAKGPDGSVADSDHRRRFVEHGIPVGADLFVVGQARERTDLVAAEIAEAKQAPMFLISTRSEQKVRRGYAAWSWVCWVLAILAGALAGAVPVHTNLGGFHGDLAGRQNELLAGAAVGAAVVLVLWGLCWCWHLYNTLVGLRQRVRQGWSLIDVQLKRRSDLIPGLVTILEAQKGHEQSVQQRLAALRSQALATQPGKPGPDPEGLVPGLRAVLEAYPELGAKEGFLKLHAELVETEQRIALAREYYNDIATHYATRLEQVPQCWVAKLGGFKAEPLLVATGFERAAVAVKL